MRSSMAKRYFPDHVAIEIFQGSYRVKEDIFMLESMTIS